MMETASTPSGATPARFDTLTLVPRDRRGVRAGVAPDHSAGRDAAPAPCGLRRHDRGAVHAAGEEPAATASMPESRPACPCPKAQRTPGPVSYQTNTMGNSRYGNSTASRSI